jgi:hypothetical protein
MEDPEGEMMELTRRAETAELDLGYEQKRVERLCIIIKAHLKRAETAEAQNKVLKEIVELAEKAMLEGYEVTIDQSNCLQTIAKAREEGFTKSREAELEEDIYGEDDDERHA